MSGDARSCAIAVMAKAPQAGRSKTRLTPMLTPEQAARVSAAFLRDITENIALAAKAAPIAAYVAYAPAGLEALFEGHLAAGTRLVLADGNSRHLPADMQGFGRCLLHAVQALLAQGHASACVLNSDSPTLPNAILAKTARLLAAPGDRAVLGPAEDGGYYLLGLKAAHAHLFEAIAWSTDQVAEQTRQRAREIGLELVTLPSWYDVDDAVALRRLANSLAAPGPAKGPAKGLAPYPAPATAACLRALGIDGGIGGGISAAPGAGVAAERLGV